MDDFNNFFDREPSNHTNRTPIYHTPEPKRKTNTSPALIISLVLAVIMCIVMVVNVIVLASLKDTIADKYATKMAQQMRDQYAEAINDALTQQGVIDDVTDAAISGALDALKSSVGEVANECAKSVARLSMYEKAVSKNSLLTTKPDSISTAFLITDATEEYPQRYLVTNAHCATYVTKYTESTGGLLGGITTKYKWSKYSLITCKFDDDDEDYEAEIISYGSYKDTDDDGNVTIAPQNEQPDLAILRIKGTQPSNEDHPSLKLASSDANRGEPVAIIGNPEDFGEVNSIATGVISQTGIKIKDWGSGMFILTDAAVNGGNSGGPMINRLGQVIGIVESKLVSEEIDNMGFALTVSTLKNFILWAQQPANNEKNQALTIPYNS